MKKISFIIPCYASSKVIEFTVDEIKDTMSKNIEYSYEIILVNDCSPDNTFEVIRNICNHSKEIIGINLAKNFGQHSAIMAGFHYASGDIIVCLDDDGQTPANEVFKLIEKIEQGYDVVYAKYTQKKHSLFRNLGSKVNFKMAEYLLDKPKELYISSYFAAKRFVIEYMKEYTHSFPYVIGLVLRVTKNITNVTVNHRNREVGHSGYTLKKLIALWINGFTAFSVKPLRITTIVGIFLAIIGIFMSAFVVIKKLLIPNIVVGYSSLMATQLLMGGFILFSLGMIGEYIGRIYISINNSPQYVIREIYTKENNQDKSYTKNEIEEKDKEK